MVNTGALPHVAALSTAGSGRLSDVPALTITELERATGVPRSTIYYYVREGLLPPAQKAAVSRGIYAEAHVGLLTEIGRLKGLGMSMAAIKEALADRVASAGLVEVDLVAQQTEKTRRAILETAARQFARGGYNRTRIADIMQEVGVSPPVFYGHFRTKRQLFLESFTVYLGWMKQYLEPRIVKEPVAALSRSGGRVLRAPGAQPRPALAVARRGAARGRRDAAGGRRHLRQPDRGVA
jgi:AcrR family transcriptional regulator